MGRFADRASLALAAALSAGLVFPPPAAAKKPYQMSKVRGSRPYSHVIKLKIGPFPVGAAEDREVCEYVELPFAKVPTTCTPGAQPGDADACGLTIVGYDIAMKGTGVSHHFILWAYEGPAEGADRFPKGIHDSKACIDFGPADTINTRQIGGSQSQRLRTLLPRGLGQQVRALSPRGGEPRGIGLILNSHYIGKGRPTTGSVKLKLYVARPGTVRAYGKLIFDVIAGAFIEVPPGQVKTTSFSWEVGGPSFPIVGGPPANDACVVFLTGHMHKRGLGFTTDLVDANGAERIYESTDYADMGGVTFAPPKLMTRGMQFRYECTHDNGVTTPVKMGCELEPGVTPGIPQWRAFVQGGLDGSARGCATDADCAGIGTGRCVPANLVFGFTSDDDMCILPGMYYDAIAGAPPGRECDLSLLPVL